MKKIRRHIAVERSRRAWRNWLKKKRHKASKWVIVRLVAPRAFNFSTHYVETVDYLRLLKRETLAQREPNVRKNVHIDLVPIESISLAGALVLAAEIDRWRRRKRARLQPRDVGSWNPEVRQMLDALGFFRLLGVRLGKTDETEQSGHEHVVLVPLTSENKLDGRELWEALEFLGDVAQFLQQDPRIYAALTEAAYNATLHAYPNGYDFEFPPLRKRWWMTACWRPKEGDVKFLVYDQGVGIPETLPRSGWWEHIRLAAVKLSKGSLSDDASMIEAAIQVSRSSLAGGHGKGLRDIVSPVLSLPGGCVRILSGRGTYICYSDGRAERRNHPQHIGGTLVEWTIPVGQPLQKVES
jgi:hypothetical protein